MSDKSEAGEPLVDLDLGPATVLFGARGGKYPHGNSLWVRGGRESVIIDPSLGVVARGGTPPPVDRVLFSHCHEDHIAGAHLYPDVPWHFHEADLPGIQSLDAFMGIYGFPPHIDAAFRPAVQQQFHFMARPDSLAYRDADIFDLGGVRVRVLHTPGHTRGHCCFLIDWDGSEDRILYLGDIDLSSFGPYYGDAWSNLEDFERSLKRVREVEVRWYATFHHIGVLDTREQYLERLDRFAGVIPDREARLLSYLDETRSLDEIAEHRFIYRPGDAVEFAEAVERRSMSMHLDRLVAAGHVTQGVDGRYVRN